ncbi:MAG: cupin domain-containing protein [Ginsengibacter sp.]
MRSITFHFTSKTCHPVKKLHVHKHLNNDEMIFIHNGGGILTLDEESIEVKPGDVAFVPRSI